VDRVINFAIAYRGITVDAIDKSPRTKFFLSTGSAKLSEIFTKIFRLMDFNNLKKSLEQKRNCYLKL
jgi:hypothetical protein